MKEVWKPVLGYEGLYQVTQNGLVKSMDQKRHRKKSIFMRPYKNRAGYMWTKLRDADGKRSSHSIHRIVLEAFVGKSDLVIDHKNGNKEDNRLDNLRYVTQRENMGAFRSNQSSFTSKFTGVYRNREGGKLSNWRAKIQIGKKHKHLGTFESEIEAAMAYKNEVDLLTKDKNK